MGPSSTLAGWMYLPTKGTNGKREEPWRGKNGFTYRAWNYLSLFRVDSVDVGICSKEIRISGKHLSRIDGPAVCMLGVLVAQRTSKQRT
jgi:hypothetical protein